MTTWDYIRNTLEALYFLAGIALATGLFFALKQFKLGVQQIDLLKRDMEDRSRRAAVEKVLNTCNTTQNE